MDKEAPFRHRSIWHMVLAPAIWAVHFVSVYAVSAVTCAKLGVPDLARWSVLGLTILALVAIGIISRRAWVQWDYFTDHDYVHDQPTIEHRREFLGHVGFLLGVVSAVGVIYVALPAAFIGSCR